MALDHLEIPMSNNHAEREIRPAVIMSKVMQGNRSRGGANTQAVLMSISRTLKRRGHKPIDSLVQALQTSIWDRQLPPLPRKGLFRWVNSYKNSMPSRPRVPIRHGMCCENFRVLRLFQRLCSFPCRLPRLPDSSAVKDRALL
ncbi:MAG: transposase [bacterium]